MLQEQRKELRTKRLLQGTTQRHLSLARAYPAHWPVTVREQSKAQAAEQRKAYQEKQELLKAKHDAKAEATINETETNPE